jgi:8-oxo-(d)GTP phosphatase
VPPIVAAGAVVSRKGPEVLLVHRPKYDDWSLPKGKLDTGEHPAAAAVREVAEETGLTVRLCAPLPTQTYPVGNGGPRTKHVHYWAARVVGDDDVTRYVANAEVDGVVWLSPEQARQVLSYERDRVTLDGWATVRRVTHPLLVLRHAAALPRRSWRGDDRERGLSEEGVVQAERLVPVLGAYGVRRVVSSSSRRCWTTVTPYAEEAGLEVQTDDALSEEDGTRKSVEARVRRLLDVADPAVLCIHRPLLPWVWAALGVEEHRLEPGHLVVVHHRGGALLATEVHGPG